MATAPGRPALLASGALACLFLADVIGGRLLSARGGTGIPELAQFLAFFAAVVCFVVAILQKERAVGPSSLAGEGAR